MSNLNQEVRRNSEGPVMPPLPDRRLALLHTILSKRDHETAFAALNELCESIRGSAESIGGYGKLLGFRDIHSRVAEIDAVEEKFSALKILASASAKLSDYPWQLTEFYSQEFEFIEQVVGWNRVESLTYFGHGAISQLAMLITTRVPRCVSHFVDLDPDMSDLQKRVLTRFAVPGRGSFRTGDLASYQSDAVADLAIVSNAALPALIRRGELPGFRFIFVRSATPDGALLYPRLETELSGASLVARASDPLWGIHEWLIFENRRYE